MTKVNNSTKGWGNVLKPQGQADTPVVIQPREMKLDELVAVLDKISHKGIMPVPYQHGYLSSGFMGRYGVAVSFDKFTYDRDFKTYTAHMEDEGVYVDIRNIGQEGVEVGLMNLKKQQLEKVLGTDNEYKLPRPVVLIDFNGKGTQAVVDSVMLTNEYDDLVLTWQGQYTGTDGKVYKHEFDPDDDNISNNASVITDLCDFTIKDIQQELGQSEGQASAQTVDAELEKQIPTHETMHKSNYTPPKLSPEEFYQRQANDEKINAEQALHDNFEKLMKEQEKEEQSKGIKR